VRQQRKAEAAFLKVVAGTTAGPSDPHAEFFKQHDPALRGINAHRQATRVHTEAVRIEFASEGNVTKAALARLNETTSEACGDLFSAARVLVKTQPTTMLGAIAVLQYLADQFDKDGDCSNMPDNIDGEAWPAVFFRTLAAALIQVQP
jgi:hypothetical protein